MVVSELRRHSGVGKSFEVPVRRLFITLCWSRQAFWAKLISGRRSFDEVWPSIYILDGCYGLPVFPARDHMKLERKRILRPRGDDDAQPTHLR
jgi:hypothetical protein